MQVAIDCRAVDVVEADAGVTTARSAAAVRDPRYTVIPKSIKLVNFVISVRFLDRKSVV